MTRLTDEQIEKLLPALPGHPEPRSFTWSVLETRVIREYGRAAIRAALQSAGAGEPVASVSRKAFEEKWGPAPGHGAYPAWRREFDALFAHPAPAGDATQGDAVSGEAFDAGALMDALRHLIEVYDAMGAPRGPARIMAEAALASRAGQEDKGGM